MELMEQGEHGVAFPANMGLKSAHEIGRKHDCGIKKPRKLVENSLEFEPFRTG